MTVLAVTFSGRREAKAHTHTGEERGMMLTREKMMKVDERVRREGVRRRSESLKVQVRVVEEQQRWLQLLLLMLCISASCFLFPQFFPAPLFFLCDSAFFCLFCWFYHMLLASTHRLTSHRHGMAEIAESKSKSGYFARSRNYGHL